MSSLRSNYLLLTWAALHLRSIRRDSFGATLDPRQIHTYAQYLFCWIFSHERWRPLPVVGFIVATDLRGWHHYAATCLRKDFPFLLSFNPFCALSNGLQSCWRRHIRWLPGSGLAMRRCCCARESSQEPSVSHSSVIHSCYFRSCDLHVCLHHSFTCLTFSRSRKLKQRLETSSCLCPKETPARTGHFNRHNAQLLRNTNC